MFPPPVLEKRNSVVKNGRVELSGRVGELNVRPYYKNRNIPLKRAIAMKILPCKSGECPHLGNQLVQGSYGCGPGAELGACKSLFEGSIWIK